MAEHPTSVAQPSRAPTKAVLVAQLQEAEDALEKASETRDSRVWQALLAIGVLAFTTVGLLVVYSPSLDDGLRILAFTALFGMVGELMMFTILPGLNKASIRELVQRTLSRTTFRRLMIDAARRAFAFRFIDLVVVLLLWPYFLSIIGLLLLLVLLRDVGFSAFVFIMTDEQMLHFQRRQNEFITHRPIVNILILGVLPLVLFVLGAWPFLLGGRPLVNVYISLPIVGIMLAAFYSTLAWAILRSTSEARLRLANLRGRLMRDETTSEEAWKELREYDQKEGVSV